VSLFEEGFDLVVSAGKLYDSALRFLKLGVLPRLLVASPEFFASHDRIASPSDLERSQGLWTLKELLQWPLTHTEAPTLSLTVEVAFVANRQTILVDAARAGADVSPLGQGPADRASCESRYR
jgi:hypothetical protein